ncbi:DUF6188 family protein [Nocardia cyriacigeorgica]|uniref:DUF6188 family protein n=1 Tax=Nocardia cyriacigeorgica TaxID=135487 RepID=UPI0024591030|nr:DUF6188 family protein [Nocardia cyriacigeorgica]
MDLQVVGMRVAEVTIGFTVTMRLGESSEYELQVEGDLEIFKESQLAYRVESECYEDQRELIESFVGSVVETATTDSSGALELKLNSGLAVRVPQDADYEAWSLVGPRGYRIVCLPGGQLAIWSPK